MHATRVNNPVEGQKSIVVGPKTGRKQQAVRKSKIVVRKKVKRVGRNKSKSVKKIVLMGQLEYEKIKLKGTADGKNREY